MCLRLLAFEAFEVDLRFWALPLGFTHREKTSGFFGDEDLEEGDVPWML